MDLLSAGIQLHLTIAPKNEDKVVNKVYSFNNLDSYHAPRCPDPYVTYYNTRSDKRPMSRHHHVTMSSSGKGVIGWLIDRLYIQKVTCMTVLLYIHRIYWR